MTERTKASLQSQVTTGDSSDNSVTSRFIIDLLDSIFTTDEVTATASELNTLDGITATTAELNLAADNSANVETVTTTNVIAAAESGKTFFLDAAAGFASTLPAPAAGLRFTFIVKTAPTSGGYTIGTNGGDDVLVVGFNELEVDTNNDGPYASDGDVITFVANVAVAGDYFTVISDGTKWYGHGQTNADGGATIAHT